ncbi:MAG TPA: glutamate racemase [Dehalococcoidia bacterium]|nr:glutamate racemase [Dehalococcoidia bacterium]
MDGRPIGFLDSGVGGLSLLAATRRLLPHERYIALADGRYFPYGESDPDGICERVERLSAFLLDGDVKLIVAACNTASVHALAHLRASFPVIPFVGVVPVVKTLARRTRTGTIALLSTPATAESPYLAELLREFAPGKRVLNIPCPGLAEAVEAGEVGAERTSSLLAPILEHVSAAGADVLGLGCTHYFFLRPAIKRILGSGVQVFDASRPVARRVRQVLLQRDALGSCPSGPDEFYTTGDAARFAVVAQTLLRRPIESVAAVDLD